MKKRGGMMKDGGQDGEMRDAICEEGRKEEEKSVQYHGIKRVGRINVYVGRKEEQNRAE
jgi:hypothetical protein